MQVKGAEEKQQLLVMATPAEPSDAETGSSDEGNSGSFQSTTVTPANLLPQVAADRDVPVAREALTVQVGERTVDPVAREHLLTGAVRTMEPEQGVLSHHLLHRAVLGGAFMFASGANRWLGYPGLLSQFASWNFTGGAAQALAGLVCFMSFSTTNMLGAYAVNRMPFEGVFGVGQAATGMMASFAAFLDGMASYRALLALGLPSGVAVTGAGLNFLNNQFLFWNLLERMRELAVGHDHKKEQIAQRAQWLQKRLTESLTTEELQELEQGEDPRLINKALDVALDRKHQSRWHKFCCILPLSSRWHKARNVLAELQQLQKAGHDISPAALQAEARESRVAPVSKSAAVRLAGFGSLFAVSMAFTWSDVAGTVNAIISPKPFIVTCTQSVLAAYSSLHAIGQVAAITETLATARICYDNSLVLVDWLRNKKWQQALRCNRFVDKGFFLFGLSASCCYTFTLYGAVRTGLAGDVCLRDSGALNVLLPLAGATAGALHTWNVGLEVKQVLNSFKTLGKQIIGVARKQRSVS